MTVASTGNATDFGDLTTSSGTKGSVDYLQNQTRAVRQAGQSLCHNGRYYGFCDNWSLYRKCSADYGDDFGRHGQLIQVQLTFTEVYKDNGCLEDKRKKRISKRGQGTRSSSIN